MWQTSMSAFHPLRTLEVIVILARVKVRWLNLVIVEAVWAAMAYFLGEGWFQRVFIFIVFNMVLLWGWRKSRAAR